jgi:hypothetical protein
VGCSTIGPTDEPNLTRKVFHFASSPFSYQERDFAYTIHCVSKSSFP